MIATHQNSSHIATNLPAKPVGRKPNIKPRFAGEPINIHLACLTSMHTLKLLLIAVTAVCSSNFATADEVVGAVVGGSVVSISGDSITIKSETGEKSLAISSSTLVRGNAKSIAEVVVGAEVAVRCNAEGTGAVVIQVLPPIDKVVSGTVVSISETSITLNTEQGDETFAVTSDTVKKNWVAISEIKVGNKIAIRVSADRKIATLINAKP